MIITYINQMISSHLPVILNLFHIFVVAPFLIYLGYKKNKAPNYLYLISTILGIILLLYHAYQYFKTNWWINLMHIYIGLIFILFGLYGRNLPNFMYNFFYLIAFIIIIWHISIIISKLNHKKEI
jgi:prepilin signal peptidase PulO-like enzyme (type II secretory pathway)